jgi:hypothetical protein
MTPKSKTKYFNAAHAIEKIRLKGGIFVTKVCMAEQEAFGHGLTDLFIRQSLQLFGTACSILPLQPA